jgi:hypothetical protein
MVGSDVGSSGDGGTVTSRGGQLGQVMSSSPLSGRLDTAQPSGSLRCISACGFSLVTAILMTALPPVVAKNGCLADCVALRTRRMLHPRRGPAAGRRRPPSARPWPPKAGPHKC